MEIEPTMPTDPAADRIDEITEGLYRWTIDTVNTAIEIAAKKEGGLKQPILGTGTAPLLPPSKANEALRDLIAAEVARAEVAARIDELQRIRANTGSGTIARVVNQRIDTRIKELQASQGDSH